MIYKLKVNGNDVTQALLKNMVSIELIDRDGEESDEITMTVIGDFSRPEYKDKLSFWAGRKALEFFGTFEVQSTKKSLDHTLEIKATATNFQNTLKQRRDKSYQDTTLKKISEEIAKTYNLKSRCDVDHTISHVAQTNESDLNFLTRLAKDHNAIFSIKNDTLIFRDKSDKSSLPLFEIDAGECSTLEITHSNESSYESCKALWHDSKENIQKSVTVGSGEPTLKYRDNFKDEADAKKKATAKLALVNANLKCGSLEKYGEYISAGSRIEIFNSFDDGEYIVKEVTHTFGEEEWDMVVEFKN